MNRSDDIFKVGNDKSPIKILVGNLSDNRQDICPFKIIVSANFNSEGYKGAPDDLQQGEPDWFLGYREARAFPAAIEKTAEASKIALQLIEKIAEKLNKKYYLDIIHNRRGGDQFQDRPNLQVRSATASHGYEFVIPLTQARDGKNMLPINPTQLAKDAKAAYEEVLRENKSLAAYMNKGQGAKLGA
jgi:hypothetical protein